MKTYLVGILYHEPEPWALWKTGVIEDYESSTALFVEADTEEAALSWASQVGEALLRKENADETLDWVGLGNYCWIEADPSNCHWQHCLAFFQKVAAGEWPDLSEMGSEAYGRWSDQNL